MSGSHLIPENEEELENTAEELSHDEQLEKLSHVLHLAYSNFKKIGYSLADRKKRAPVRVLEALMFGEFHDIELKGKEEKVLLDMCTEIVQTKATMYNLMVQKQLEKEEQNESK